MLTAGEDLTGLTSFESFLDGTFPKLMEKWNVPGAAFALVTRERLLMLKSFGVGDLKESTPVSAERSIFRVASVSKLFTTVAIMQLVEAGKLDLHVDVEEYLDFPLHKKYAQPITAHHLLTHTSGLDDRFIGIASRPPSGSIPLGAYLAARMPRQILPPGRFINYSNHAFSLLGYLVERISGLAFCEFVDRKILKPLAMHRSSFQLPDALKADLVTGYAERKGGRVPLSYDHMHIGPSASLVSTASDMACFLQALLWEGRHRTGRLLQEETFREMQRRHFCHHPRLPGRCYGFHERFQNGRRGIGHAGGMHGFASLLFLLPQEGCGFFLVYNRFEARLYEELTRQFFEHLFPESSPGGGSECPQECRGELTEFAGRYRHFLYYCREGFEKLLTLSTQFEVRIKNGGGLALHYPGNERDPIDLIPAGKGLFRRLDNDSLLAFQQPTKGPVECLFMGTGALEKLAVWEWAPVQKKLFFFFWLLFTLLPLIWPIGPLLLTRAGGIGAVTDSGSGAELLAALASLLNAFFLTGMAWTKRRIDPGEYLYGMPLVVRGLLLIPVVSLLIIPVLAFTAFFHWPSPAAHPLLLAHFLVTSVLLGLFVPFLRYWNLLGWKF